MRKAWEPNRTNLAQSITPRQCSSLWGLLRTLYLHHSKLQCLTTTLVSVLPGLCPPAALHVLCVSAVTSSACTVTILLPFDDSVSVKFGTTLTCLKAQLPPFLCPQNWEIITLRESSLTPHLFSPPLIPKSAKCRWRHKKQWTLTWSLPMLTKSPPVSARVDHSQLVVVCRCLCQQLSLMSLIPLQFGQYCLSS